VGARSAREPARAHRGGHRCVRRRRARVAARGTRRRLSKDHGVCARLGRASCRHDPQDDSSETYRADVLELADGQAIGYRVHVNEAGRAEFVPQPRIGCPRRKTNTTTSERPPASMPRLRRRHRIRLPLPTLPPAMHTAAQRIKPRLRPPMDRTPSPSPQAPTVVLNLHRAGYRREPAHRGPHARSVGQDR